VDELEGELEDAMVEEFNTECEDGSPRQVATTLIELHTQCLQGVTALLEQLRSRQASGAAASKRQVVSAWPPNSAPAHAAQLQQRRCMRGAFAFATKAAARAT
jgi:hypothetical protein